MRLNACVDRLDLGLYSHPKEFGGMESEPMLTPREKSPLPEKFSSEVDGTHDLHQADSEPNTLPMSYFGPHVMILVLKGIVSGIGKVNDF